MRYTRNRQLNRKWMNRKWKMPAIKIEDVYNDNALVCSDYLDKTFKWHREYNNVSFDTTHYYPHKVTVPLFVDLYKEDSVYY
ncbi:hypothetical protein ABEZ32_24055 [Bacillus mycoides]|uniref:hypothetical protein n=1 Tax=Bacillus mycoides TaxID=1405 RepID=UPI003D1DC596